MARVKFGTIVTSIRGSVGGSTFQNNAFGSTLKNKSLQVRPNTQLQQIQKSIFSKAVKSWRNFNDTQRGNWNTFAMNFPQATKSDDTVFISGFNAFVKWQSAKWIGDGISSTPDGTPGTSMPAIDTVTISLTLSAGVLRLITDWVTGDESWQVNFFISRPRLDSQLFVGSSRRFLLLSNNIDNNQNITTLYINLFGVLPKVGDMVNVGYVLFTASGGLVQAIFNARVTVT